METFERDRSIILDWANLESSNNKSAIRVLHVDDDPAILEVSKQILIDMGNFEIDHAYCVDEALKKLSSKQYDVVISDYDMPYKNGLQFLKVLREQNNEIPFMLFTGKGREEVAIKALNLGAEGYYNKQGNPETVYGELAFGIKQNVERKKTKESLKKNEEQLKAIILNAPIGIAWSDSKKFFLSANESFCGTLGYSENELQKLTFKEITYPDDVNDSISKMEELSSGRISFFSQEKRYIRKDGTVINGKVTVNAIRNSAGEPTLFIAQLEDVTQRKKAERALADSEERYKNLFENAPDVIVTFDLTGKITSINKAILQFGFKENELVGNSIFKLVPLEYTQEMAKGLKNIALGNSAHREMEMMTPIGKRSIEYNSNPIWLDGKVVGYQTIIRDATERKKAEEEMRKSEFISQNCSDLIIITNLQGKITFWNKGSAEIFGYSDQEIIGEPITKLLTPGDKERIAPAMLEQMGKGKTAIGEWQGSRKDGSNVWLMMNSMLLKNSRNEPIGLVGFGKDITERKQQEREIESLARFPSENPNPVFRIDREGIILYSNEAGAFLLNDWNTKVNGRAPERVSKIVIDAITHDKRIELEETCEAKTFSLLFVSVPLEGYVNIYVNDITERKKTEVSLKETKDQLELQFTKMPIGCIVWDKDFKVVSWNSAAETIFGYSAKDIVGKHSYGTIVPKEAQPSVEKIWRRLLEGGESVNSVNDNLTKQGKLITCSWSNTPLKREDNSVIGVLSMVQDVTDRNKAEIALRISEERFHQLVLSSPDTIHLLDPVSRKVEFLNRNEFLGYSREELEGSNSILPFLHPEDRELLQTYYQLVLTGTPDGQKPVEYRLKSKAGNWEWVRSRATILKHDEQGKPEQILVTLSVITESKKTEDSLKESEEKFRNLAEESPNIIFINKGGRVLYTNKRSEDITGYTREEFYSPNFNFLSICAPEYVELMKSSFERHMRGENVSPYDYVLLSKEGKRVDVMTTSKLIEYEGEKAILGIVTDISELKKAEETLNQTMNELVNVNEKLGVVGSLTRHDVRNKLGVITGNIYLLKKKHSESPEAMDRLVQMEQACKSIVRIFDFAKMYEQLGIEALSFINVEKVVDEAIALFSGTANVKIINECHGISVLADSLLRQMCYNLIDNSIKHGQKVTNIRMHYEKADQDKLNLIYEDDGIGVPVKNKAQLFKEGFSTGGGTGFGLFLIKKMMDVYGWQIQENGTPYEGAKFIITIPKLNKSGKENYQTAP